MENMMENGHIITNTVKSKIVWQIDNFSSHANQTEAIKSPEFKIIGPNGNKNKLFMKMYPNGLDGKQEYAALSVKLAEDNGEVPARIELAIMDSDGEKHETVRSTTNNGERIWQVLTPTSELESTEFERSGLSFDNLTIECHIDIEQVESPVDNIPIPPCQLSADFANLLERGILTDFVLISSDNKEFKVHKNVLACRSPVFAAMFRDGMTETTTNQVKIEDIRGDVLDKMLHFIYTGNAPNIGATAKELLAAADKYQIERLKVLCERSLALSLNNGNACELLVWADLNSADLLKSEANQFIKSNAEEVIEMDGWKWLATEHPRFVVTLYEGMIKRKKRKLVNDDA